MRAIKQAVQTSADIQGKARQRQRKRLAGEANPATALDTDLKELHVELSNDKRAIVGAGLVPDGTEYRGRTWRAQ